MATKVVMLTAMAGAGLDLSYGDVYETDDVEATRFLEHNAARKFDEKEDANKPVKRKQNAEAIAEGHFQNDKPKGKKKKTGQTGDQESTDVAGESTSTSGSTDGSTGDDSSPAGELAGSSSESSADAEPANAGPEDKPAQAPTPAPRPRTRR